MLSKKMIANDLLCIEHGRVNSVDYGWQFEGDHVCDEIAAALRLSDKAVKNYLANRFQKLHISSLTQLQHFLSRDDPISRYYYQA